MAWDDGMTHSMCGVGGCQQCHCHWCATVSAVGRLVGQPSDWLVKQLDELAAGFGDLATMEQPRTEEIFAGLLLALHALALSHGPAVERRVSQINHDAQAAWQKRQP